MHLYPSKYLIQDFSSNSNAKYYTYTDLYIIAHIKVNVKTKSPRLPWGFPYKISVRSDSFLMVISEFGSFSFDRIPMTRKCPASAAWTPDSASSMTMACSGDMPSKEAARKNTSGSAGRSDCQKIATLPQCLQCVPGILGQIRWAHCLQILPVNPVFLLCKLPLFLLGKMGTSVSQNDFQTFHSADAAEQFVFLFVKGNV